jgi:hypothetical protein
MRNVLGRSHWRILVDANEFDLGSHCHLVTQLGDEPLRVFCFFSPPKKDGIILIRIRNLWSGILEHRWWRLYFSPEVIADQEERSPLL